MPEGKLAAKYTDLDMIYTHCSGPGGLELAEFLAEKMQLRPGSRLLDVGCNRGVQSCFLAREFDVNVVAIDPWDDRMENRPMVEFVRERADEWNVSASLLAIKIGVPHTGFAAESFDNVYSTTALEMIRNMEGEEGYLACLKEIRRVLRPGGVFALGEPMHLPVPIPEDLEPYVSQPEFPWKECFRDLEETCEAIEKAGFEIVEAEYAPQAKQWWMAYAAHDPFCKKKPEEDPKTLEVDGGRWTSFGYIIARKPAA